MSQKDDYDDHDNSKTGNAKRLHVRLIGKACFGHCAVVICILDAFKQGGLHGLLTATPFGALKSIPLKGID